MTEAQATSNFYSRRFLDTKLFSGKLVCVHDCLRHFKLLGNLVCVAAYPKSPPALPVVRSQSSGIVSTNWYL